MQNEFPIVKNSAIIESIKAARESGLGIVPLIGSGMSAASGIPAGLDYQAYLFYCLARVFGSDGNGKKMPMWDPSTLRWPEYSDVPIYDDLYLSMSKWASDMMKVVYKEKFVQADPENVSEDSLVVFGETFTSHKNKTAANIWARDLAEKDKYDYPRWQAAGAVADWRAILKLLSRLKIFNGTVKIKHPDDRVIDSFFVNLMKNKRPNSAHMLLAHLNDILRIKIILTTNFDNLIEQAFQSIYIPIVSFDVHLDANLPDADFVRAQRSIVKMHGGRYGLRADYSLDKYPTNDEIVKFVAYLSFYKNDKFQLVENQRNLLVIGVSGNELRTVALICQAMIKLPEMTVFWLCYREDEAETVFRTFRYTFLDFGSDIEQNELITMLQKRLKISVASNLSLFLFELYQNIFLSLPPGGVQFHAVWALPPRPNQTIIEKVDNDVIRIKRQISCTFDGEPIVLSGGYGISSLGSATFYALSSIYQCGWINLHENFNPIDFAFSIINLLAYQLGVTGLIPTYVDRNSTGDLKPLKRMMKKILRYSTRRSIIFVNGREYPGEPESEAYKKWRENRWFVKLYDVLKEMLPDFTGAKTTVQYVFIHWSVEPDFPKDEKHSYHLCFNLLPNAVSIWDEFDSIDIYRTYNEVIDKYKVSQSLKTTLREKAFKIEGDRYRLERFVLAMTFFRNPCYQSILHSWMFISSPCPFSDDNDNDELRYYEAKVYLEILRKCRAIRDDDGQFTFMHNGTAEEYRKRFRTKHRSRFYFEAANCNHGIADWYMKLYRASGDVVAACESLHHRFSSILFTLEIETEQTDSSKIVEKNRIDWRRLLDNSLLETELSIELTKKRFLSSFQTSTLIALFDDFSKQLQSILSHENLNEEKTIYRFENEWRIKRLNRILKKIANIKLMYEHLIGIHIVKDMEENGRGEVSFAGGTELKRLFRRVMVDNRQWTNIIKNWGDAKRLINERKYNAAEVMLKELLSAIGISDNEIFSEDLKDTAEENATTIRNNATVWVYDKLAKIQEDCEFSWCYCQPLFELVVKILRRYQFLMLLNAQIEHYNNPGKISGVNRAFLARAVKLYIYSTQILHYISDNNFISRENAFLRTNTGVLLSRMNRHHEAYRLYNEAYSYLNFVADKDDPYEYSIIDLRRAETFLSQIEQGDYKRDYHYDERKREVDERKRRIGILFDAILSVDRAENRIVGSSVNIWWYCWMYEMQMNTCLHISRLRNEVAEKNGYRGKYDLFARCRVCEFCGKNFLDILDNAFQIVNDDVLRLIRYVKLTYDYLKEYEGAKNSHYSEHNSVMLNKLNKYLRVGMDRLEAVLKKYSQDGGDKFVLKYANKITNEVDAELNKEKCLISA